MSFLRGAYHTDAPAPLPTILEALLHRRIWTPAQALAHMDAEHAAAPRPSALWPIRKLLRELVSWSGLAGMAMFATAAVSAAVLMFSSVAGLFVDPAYRYFFTDDLGMAWWCTTMFFKYPLPLGIIGGILTITMLELALVNIRGPAVWEPCSFKVQKNDVWAKMPDEVKRGGEAIQLLLPDAVLTVLVLKQGYFNLDPVLEVAYTNPTTGEVEKAYPYIWDKHGNLLEPH